MRLGLCYAPPCAGACIRTASGVRARQVIAQAKKEKKSGKGAQKKGGGALAGLLKKKEEAGKQAATPVAEQDVFASPEQYKDPDVVFQLLAICQSYWKQYDEYLLETGLDQLAEAMYKAPFVCLAHNKFEPGVTDPCFTYANRAALQLWETTWDELVGLPSRLSAAPAEQEEREKLLEQTASSGNTSSYEGWRQSLKGTRFKIKNVKLFNVTDASGDLCGQAVVFDRYEMEDGTLVTIQGEAPPQLEIPPSKEDVAAAEAAAQQQAEEVRALKEGQGLGNKDPAVVAAVEKLQELKAAMADVQQRYEAACEEAVTDTHMSTMEDDSDEEPNN